MLLVEGSVNPNACDEVDERQNGYQQFGKVVDVAEIQVSAVTLLDFDLHLFKVENPHEEQQQEPTRVFRTEIIPMLILEEVQHKRH